jgi:hypothetical protein
VVGIRGVLARPVGKGACVMDPVAVVLGFLAVVIFSLWIAVQFGGEDEQ